MTDATTPAPAPSRADLNKQLAALDKPVADQLAALMAADGAKTFIAGVAALCDATDTSPVGNLVKLLAVAQSTVSQRLPQISKDIAAKLGD